MPRIALGYLASLAVIVLSSGAAHAQFKSCGDGGDCTVETKTPGCSDVSCCETVCTLDLFCCDFEWDSSCVALAKANCNFECSGAPEIFFGDNAFDTTGSAAVLDLTGICDPGPYGDDMIHNVIYYRFMPTSDAMHVFSTCNQATYDTRLAILSGCNPSDVIVCLDDTAGCATYTTILGAPLTSGEEVILAIGGYSATDLGTGTLSISIGEAEIVGYRQHTIASGGDDAWYAAYSMPFAGWSEFDELAIELGGELMVIHSQELNDIGEVLFNMSGAANGMAIGLYQDLNAPDFVEPDGGWIWTDGSAVDYTNWYPGEPNDGGGTEHFAELWTGGTWNDRGDPSGWSGFIVRMAEGTTFPPEGNADCDDAYELTLGENAFSTGNSYGTVTLPAECEGGGSTEIYNCAWFTYTATMGGTLAFSTCGSTSWDTRLAAFDSCGGTVLGCNDDACGQQSRMLLNLAKGETVKIVVGGFRPGAAGNGGVLIEEVPLPTTTDSLSINFQGGAYVDGSDGGICYDTSFYPAGAPEYATLYWQNIRGPDSTAAADWYNQGGGDNPGDLTNGEGDASGSAVGYMVNNTWRAFSYPADDSDRMRRGYLDSNGLGGISATISSVPWTSYDVVVYVGADGNDRPGSISVNGSDPLFFLTEGATGPGNTFPPMVEAIATEEVDAIRSHFAVFEGLSGDECVVTLGQLTGNIGLCGIQVIKSEGGGSCNGDINDDGVINGADFGLMLAQWGPCPGCSGDMNGDGEVNGADVGLILSYWGPCP
jgi:hypothetical protein